ncbi:Divergent VETF early transcription factor large subunit [uncultured virus]|nr:Divergent VETF early transcription factor large subunit [uncultured virus]
MDATSKFDNNVTATYKAAAILKLPVKYTYTQEDGSLHSIPSLVTARLREGKTIVEIYDEMGNVSPSLSAVEIAMLYTNMAMVEGVKPEAILPYVNQFYTYLNKVAKDEAEESNVQALELALFRDVDDFESQHRVWSQKFQSLLEKDTRTLNTIYDVQDQLEKIEPIPYSGLEVLKTTMSHSPTWKGGSAIDAEDGIEIFNQAVPSYFVPYIRYNNSTGKHYVRVYEGLPEDKDAPPLQMTIKPATQTNKIDTIYLTVWSGTPGSTPSRESYVVVVYSLTEGTIKIPCPTNNVKMMTERVQAALAAIDLGEGHEIKISGFFMIEQIDVIDSVLLYMILDLHIFYTYLYIDESINALAEKKRLQVHYRTFTGAQPNEEATGTGYIRNAAAVSITFGAATTEAESDAITPIPGLVPAAPEVAAAAPAEASLLRINVLSAESQVVLKQFIEVFTRLMRYYADNKEAFERFIDYIVPGSIPVKVQRASDLGGDLAPVAGGGDGEDEDEEEEAAPAKGGRKAVADSKIKNLKALAPEVFVKKFARKCQCPLHPIIIKPDEVEAWQQHTFIDEGGVVKNRQVMPYPPPRTTSEVPRWFIVCPDDNKPYPTLKENRDLSNSKDFPYVPCCAMSDSLTSQGSNYYKFHQAKDNPELLAKPKETTKINYRMTTLKILQPGRAASIPKLLVDLLRSATAKPDSNEEEDFIRMGVPSSTSSLIHCVSLARQDKEYMTLATNEEKEKYVQYRRQQMAGYLAPLLFKQELYDMSQDDIKQRLADPKVFLDPYLFYRGVEEFFQVNIFVFNPNGPLHPITGIHDPASTGPVVEIPRCKICHIRVPRNERLSVLILKHWGAETNPLNYPQCELIISRGRIAVSKELIVKETVAGDDALPLPELEESDVAPVLAVVGGGGYGSAPGVSSKATYIFDPTTSEILSTVVNASFHSYVWSFPRKAATDRTDKPASTLQIRDDPYSRIDWSTVFGEYKVVSQQVDGYGKLRVIGVSVPIQDQKENMIVSVCVPPSQPLNVPELKDITVVPEQLVHLLLGEPSGVTRVGLWYTALDYRWAVFVPAKIESTADSESPPPPVQPSMSLTGPRADLRDPIKDIRYTKRLADILMQLINWCWRNDRGNLTLEQWWDQWVVRDTSEAMKLNDRPIQPQRINRRLPKADSTLSALNALDPQRGVPRSGGSGESSPLLPGASGPDAGPWWRPYFVGGREPPSKLPTPAALPLLDGPVAAAPAAVVVAEAAAPLEEQKGYAGIHLYPKLYDMARAYFVREAHLTDGLPLDNEMVAPATHLAGLYQWDTDFIQVPKSIVFTEDEHLRAWLTMQLRRGAGSTSAGSLIHSILRKVSLSMYREAEPFIYHDTDTGKMYLVQNVKGGEVSRALGATLNWYHRGINDGLMTAHVDIALETVPHVIYGISRSETLVVVEDKSNKSLVYVQLLRYAPDNYAAMLPIL